MPGTLPVHERDDTPEPPVTLTGLRLHVRSVEFSLTERVTVPMKPFAGVMVTVEVFATLILAVTEAGLAVTVKS